MQPVIYNIPAGIGFADALAEHLLHRHQDVSSHLILLPNRRSILSLRQAFLQASEGKALLLPKMVALADIDEKTILRFGNPDTEILAQLHTLLPATEELSRSFSLAKLILSYHHERRLPMRFDQAYMLAADLAEMLDELHREGCDFNHFDSLAPAEFAEEWQHILNFLKIIREYWPLILAENNQIDPWVRRNSLIAMLSQSWQKKSPDYSVIIAGTTGSIPAIADLMKTTLNMPKGEIYLPAFDTEMSNEALTEAEDSHPQSGMQQLLNRLGINRKDVSNLHTEHNARRHWLSQALLPAASTDTWRSNPINTAEALSHCHYIITESTQQEALAIALLLREKLESPEKTAALITTDRNLSRQVRAQMTRWNIPLDDSAGTPLHHSPAGNFLLLLLEAIQEKFSATTLLALMKHPLCRLQYQPAEIRRITRQIERKAMRGIQPAGLLSLLKRIEKEEEATALLQKLILALEPLQNIAAAEESFIQSEHPLKEILLQLQKAAELLSTNHNQKILLWHSEDGAALQETLEELLTTPPDVHLSLYEFQLFLRVFLSQKTSRTKWQKHPRLQILSPMEARMIRADRIILGGLNEGSWPHKTEADPWLNRPMRTALGLPSPEHQIGLLAHDFYSLASMPEVFLTRAAKEEGAVTVPSRFLQRMQAVLEISGNKEAVTQWQNHPLTAWVKQLESGREKHPALQPPAPCPPLSTRPHQFSATSLETLMRDPYAIYAKQILKLKKLDPLEMLPEAREFGTALHSALENFAIAKGWEAPNPLALLIEKGQQSFQHYMQFSPIIHALWWPRFERVAEWVMQQGWPADILIEQQGVWKIGNFTLRARLDRMDISETGYKIIDYKTGTSPKMKEILLGLGIQLTLAAAMVEEGCFGEALQHRQLEGLSYWQLSGGMKGGTIKEISLKNAPQLIAELKDKLPRLLQEYESPEKAYLGTPNKLYALRYNDYAHLERIAEWGGL